jgi:AraC family transcriptional activator of pobA
MLVDAARAGAPSTLASVGEPVDPVIADVFELIDERYAEGLTLSAVARALTRSPGHLTRTVKDLTGETIGELIEARKMVEARRLLLESDLTGEVIAQQLGFADSSHFRRRFRRLHGMPPQVWRQLNR